MEQQMEVPLAEVLTSARSSDVSVSIRPMNRPSWEASMVGWPKNVMPISPRLGASILATKLSKYVLVPRYLRHVSAGRAMRWLGCGGKPTNVRREGRVRKWSDSVSSLASSDKALAKASGGKYPTLGISWSRRSTRLVEGERCCRSAGKGKSVKYRVRRRGPHRKALGRVTCTLARD